MKLKKFKFIKVKSTNDTAKRLINKNYTNGFILSETQKKGKGQKGNKWISKKGNIFISIFFQINNKLSLKKITIINLKIINKIINKLSSVKTTIKFPNDILINNHKVCGILQETIYKNENRFLIIGIGINLVNSPKISNYPTTYLNKYSIRNIYKIEIKNKIKLDFEKKYYKFKN